MPGCPPSRFSPTVIVADPVPDAGRSGSRAGCAAASIRRPARLSVTSDGLRRGLQRDARAIVKRRQSEATSDSTDSVVMGTSIVELYCSEPMRSGPDGDPQFSTKSDGEPEDGVLRTEDQLANRELTAAAEASVAEESRAPVSRARGIVGPQVLPPGLQSLSSGRLEPQRPRRIRNSDQHSRP